MTSQPIDLADAQIRYQPQWLAAPEADRLFATLCDSIAWERHRIVLFGRAVDAPRLSCWIGDADAVYTYSRARYLPRPWPDALCALRERLRQESGTDFNGVLANLYRDGNDSMGWHADDEPELGVRPLIASLSLGATRRFVLRRRDASAGNPDPAHRLAIELGHGSLLWMGGDTQLHYRHALPKTSRAVGMRVNLTFRKLEAAPTLERASGGHAVA
jgi:alkylated DNA repair dioxygenase AlkB